MQSTHHGPEDGEKLARAKRQLLIIGVVCVALVIFLLWAVNLKYTLTRNRQRYPSPLTTLRQSMKADNNWQQLQQQINTIKDSSH